MSKINEIDYKRLYESRLFVLDMDGTLYLGDEVIPGAIEFVNNLSKRGLGYIYLTNNSSRAGVDYIERLRRLGFPCEAENVFTSGMATGIYLNSEHKGKKVFPVGTKAFERELLSYGIELSDSDDTEIVCVGFDTELTYKKLETAVRLLRRGAVFIAANPDWVCPMPQNEVLPDCGSICALLTASTGVKPFYIGKPNRSMLDSVSKITGVPNEYICAVGDRLYTDIAVAVNAGSVSVLVMSGETDEEILEKSETKPDYVLKDVKELDEILAENYK